MPDLFSQEQIPLKCPKCGHKINKTIAWLESHHNLTCGECGHTVHLNTGELLNDLREVRQSVERLKRRIRNFQ